MSLFELKKPLVIEWFYSIFVESSVYVVQIYFNAIPSETTLAGENQCKKKMLKTILNLGKTF
jgi:hypothetical protein